MPTTVVTSATVVANSAVAPFTPVTVSVGGMQPFSYSVSPALPAGLSMASSTGAISGTPTAAQAQTTYTVSVTDSLKLSGSSTFTLTITPAVSASTAVASVTATTNVAVTPFTPVTAANGTAPYTYKVSPALPAGLTLNASTGVISGSALQGTPQTTYTITVTDAKAGTASSTFTLSVIAPVTPLVVSVNSSAPTTLPKGVPVPPFTPVAGSGGTTPLSYAVSPALPAGLVMNSSTGVVSGTPTADAATRTYTVTVTDAAAKTASASFSLTVQTGQLAATAVVPMVSVSPNAALTSVVPVMASGGTAPYAYALSSPTLALSLTGLNYDAATGFLSGTTGPVVASAKYTVAVTDGAAATVSSQFQLTSLPVGYLLFGGLTWSAPDSTKTYTHVDAEALCAGTVNGTTGWRLPSVAEAQAMLSAQAAIATSNGFLKGVGWPVSSSFYWASDIGSGTNNYYNVNFGTNTPRSAVGTNLYYVTCVK
ncbi:MAG: putative Ig domain-containing protein [Pelomonas sp.]|nr:putative Ig domain-containing protein [Roseateles sp.]